MADPPLIPLAVTTSDRVDPALFARARAAAAELSVPYFRRTHKDPLASLLRRAQALVVFESDAVALVDGEGALRFSPGLAHLRIKQLDQGVLEDRLLRETELEEGERVLDCTAGLCADAQVASRLVGSTGEVVALEKSPALYLLARYGLERMRVRPRCAPLGLLHADAADFLRAQPAASFDVVLFDPMFARPKKSSAAFSVLRRHADYSPLTATMLQDAQRVARRLVVVKGARYSSDFKKLGLKASPARPNATVVWARLPGGRP